MGVARLQRPRHPGWEHTDPDVLSRGNSKNHRRDVRLQHVDIQNKSIRLPEILEALAQETHVPNHDTGGHPALAVSPDPNAGWRRHAKPGESFLAHLVGPHQHDLRQECLEVCPVTHGSHMCDCGPLS